MQHILITGGAGFIGSYVNQLLQQQNYSTIILDNLSKGSPLAVKKGVFIEGDICDILFLDKLFSQYQIQAVLHFAALTDVGESVKNPYQYYQNNVVGTLNLLHTMQKHSVKNFIFSSTAAIFGIPQTIPVSETHPCHPINPYGHSKHFVEQILKDFDQAFGLKYCCLRYFNATGGDPQGILKNFKKQDHNLIPIILRKAASNQPISIFGTDYATPDGTCIRDYIHVHDLGCAHIAAMERLFQGSASENYNLGNGNGYSVKQVIHATEKVLGKQISVIEAERRAGDPPILVADSSKARLELEWIPQYPDLHTMISHAWEALKIT